MLQSVASIAHEDGPGTGFCLTKRIVAEDVNFLVQMVTVRRGRETGP